MKLTAFEPVVIILFLFSVHFCQCKEGNKDNDLTQYNLQVNYTVIQEKDSTGLQFGQEYCFKIQHDSNIELDKYYLVININGTIVYSDMFKARVVFPFVKETKLNTLSILLYDKKNKYVFSWSNKDVFDFEAAEYKCYKIKLFSEGNIDYSNGIKMSVE